MITLKDIKDQISKYLYLTDTDVVDVILAAFVANRIGGDSISLYLVGPSSSAKTELVMITTGSPHSKKLSQITPHTLFSGYKESSKDKMNHSKIIQWIEEGRNILVFKDFTSVMSMRREDRGILLGQLREIADGEMTADFGNRDTVELKAKVGVIAACTNAIDEFGPGVAMLGERFLKYRITAEMAHEIASSVMEADLDRDPNRIAAREITRVFLGQFEMLFGTMPRWNNDIKERVTYLCHFGAHLRSPIIKDEKDIQVSEVEHEGPGRITQSIQKFGVALAMVKGMASVDMSLYPVIKKIVRDTMPPYRLRIVDLVYAAGGEVELSQLKTLMNIDEKTTRKHVQDLVSLRICKKDTVKGVRSIVSLTDTYIKLIERSEIFIIDKI